MRIEILTTSPQMIEAVVGETVLGRARERGIVEVAAVNMREYASDSRRTTDDEPYGGGPGMVMKCEPVFAAVEAMAAKRPAEKPRIVLMTPQGRVFDQNTANSLARESYVIIVCGRYEGVDERIRTGLATDEISIGDYVLSTGELAALVVADAVARLVPGVLGDESSAVGESFADGLLEYAQYTRPAEFRGMKVPEVLLSGNHAEIIKWRRESSLRRTLTRRPDLLKTAPLSEEDRRLLDRLQASGLEEGSQCGS